MIKVLQLPAGINSDVTNNTGMPKKRRWSVQEAEQEQVTGQARLIVEDSMYVNKLISYVITNSSSPRIFCKF
jgi:hypothetical protein